MSDIVDSKYSNEATLYKFLPYTQAIDPGMTLKFQGNKISKNYVLFILKLFASKSGMLHMSLDL